MEGIKTVNKNRGGELSRAAKAVIVVAALGQIVTVAVQLVLRAVVDRTDLEASRQVDLALKFVNLTAILLLVAALFMLAREYKSRLWFSCFVLFILRALLGVVEVITRLGVQVESEGLRKFLMACFIICLLAAWIVLGLTLIIRRHDAEAGLGMTAGVAVLVSMGLWGYFFMSLVGILPFSVFLAELGGAASEAVGLVVACFLLIMVVRPGRPEGVFGGRLCLRLGAVGSLLIVWGLSLIWQQAVGAGHAGDLVFFAFIVLAGLGLVGAGLGYLGQTLATKRQFGLAAAVLIWLQLLFFVVAVIWASTIEWIWIAALLTLAAQVAGGISFIVARKLVAPAVAVSAGVILLAGAVISLVLLVFLGESGFDLPWTVRNILVAVVQFGMIAVFTLATVHHLQVSATPRA